MHPSSFLIALAATLASAATVDNEARSIQKRGCFSGGENWGSERNYAQSHAAEVCNAGLTGDYKPGDQRSKCYNLSSTKKVDFSVELRRDVGKRTLGKAECYDGLQKEVNGCDHGGNTQYTNWIYTADPNSGQCA